MIRTVLERHRTLLCVAALVCGDGLVSQPIGALQSASLTRIAEIPGPAELVQVQGNRLYVVADRALRIFDVASPSAPKPVGAFTFPERVSALAASGSHLYVLADFHGVRILDVANPASP